MPSTRGRAVCIAGMHRSGTSMVARLLNLCGLTLGAENVLLPEAADNPEGFWEHRHIIDLNDTLLAQLGGGWDFPPPLDSGWERQPGLESLHARGEQIVSELAGTDPWGWKDPRTSLTLPFWRHLVPDLKTVICVRSPTEVVQSLKRRSQSSEAFGYNLWLTYNHSLLLSTRPEDRIVTHYDAFFQDAQGELTRILSAVGLECSRDVIERACAAVSLPLRHNYAPGTGGKRVPVLTCVEETYAALCDEAGPIYDRVRDREAAQKAVREHNRVDLDYQQDVIARSPFPQSLILSRSLGGTTRLYPETIESAMSASLSMQRPGFDVICFPDAEGPPEASEGRIDDFVRHGHRIFLLHFQEAGETEGFCDVHRVGANTYAVRMKGSSETAVVRGLAVLRHLYAIDTAVSWLGDGRWRRAAHAARERWGWKVVHETAPSWIEREMELPAPAVDLRIDGATTWKTLSAAMQSMFRRVSIVVVTFNNLPYTKLCLGTVLANTEYPNYELIVVDNASSDETPDYLRDLEARHPHVHAFFNTENLGFARANNFGIAQSDGEILVLLNNDTLVSPGWLTRLVQHLASGVDLVGPVTNRSTNEAEIPVTYDTYGEFLQFAHERQVAYDCAVTDIPMLVMFCTAMTRRTYEEIGPLDHGFGIGLFEDDDYAMRARQAGFRLGCAEDTFVHHFLHASLDKLLERGDFGTLFHANRQRFEEKWGVTWQPHNFRYNAEYYQLTQQIRDLVRAEVPPGSTILVIAKGDEDLLNLPGRHARNFPQGDDGDYSGFHPADSEGAIVHLEKLRSEGAEYLLLPQPAYWWLDHYAGFGQHLLDHYATVVDEPAACRIFHLRAPGGSNLMVENGAARGPAGQGTLVGGEARDFL